MSKPDWLTKEVLKYTVLIQTHMDSYINLLNKYIQSTQIGRKDMCKSLSQSESHCPALQ